MIPKVIHYCWFGGNPLPELAKKCISSWEKYCPDYEIIEWNESNFDVNCCDYVKEAYASKKWAFVSDYARFKILYEHGGLYFDTDVELIKPFDKIVVSGGFMGVESLSLSKKGKLGIEVNPGLGLGVEAGLTLYKELLEYYNILHFINKDGSLNLKTVVSYTTEVLQKHGLESKNKIQFVAGIYIYPKEYFCPIDYSSGKMELSDNTYSIHHYSASWHNDAEKYAFELRKKLHCFLPRRISGILAIIISKIKYDGLSACLKWICKKLKK